MMYLYRIFFYLALPFIFLRLFLRSQKLPAYRERLGERLGFYPSRLDRCIWIHAVSVGESIAAIPLIKALQTHHPNTPFLVTTMTPTGALQIKKTLGDSVLHAYLPYDLSGAMKRFLTTFNPIVGIIMETELWPVLLAECEQKQIPIVLVNARLSEKSANGYHRIASITRAMLQSIAKIAANGQADADRFIALGASKDHLAITGNIKFDMTLPPNLNDLYPALRQSLGEQRFVWVAASTHDGEEKIIIDAHKKLRENIPSALLILVPRHPDRFDLVAKLVEQSGFNLARRSQSQACTMDTTVYLGDTMGELLLMYAASDVALVAGSLIPRGGHNMLEPGALSKPILTGPHLFNFAEISQLFIKAQALIIANDAEQLASELIKLAHDADLRQTIGEKALAVVNANRGALAKQLAIIEAVIHR